MNMGAGLSKNRIKGLSASVDQNSAVLILGTLPGRMSLTYGKYYADPSNKFWDILFIACGEKIDKTDQGKKQLLEKYHIALWDILYSAVRKTSNDKDISDETPNNLPLFLSQYPNIKLATVYKGNIIKNLIMDCQSYTKYRPNETTGGIFVSWRRKEELPTGA